MRVQTALLSACLFGALSPGCKPEVPATKPGAADACDGFTWLVGTWETVDGGTHNVERWMPDDGDGLRGESVTRSGGEVVYTESLRLVRVPGGFEYRASPQDQPPNVFPLEALARRGRASRTPLTTGRSRFTTYERTTR